MPDAVANGLKQSDDEEAPMTDTFAWPHKTREIQTRLVDSTIWDDFRFRDDDIIIATHSKAGTTWMQQIVGQLLFGGNPDLHVGELSPWVDMRIPPKAEKLASLEAQTHRRFVKTHLPLDALVFSPQARYIYVARDGRDVVWSFHHHLLHMRQSFRDQINRLPDGVGPPVLAPPPEDVHLFWRLWLNPESDPRVPTAQAFWQHIRTWWAARDLPNVLLVHYTNLKRDLPGEMRRIAAFLDIAVPHDRWDAIIEYCSFTWMHANPERTAIGDIDAFEGGSQTFFHRGVNGRWSDILSREEIAEYEARAVEELGPECALWLAKGAANRG
jgi:aryl sulfotransferase